MTVMNDFAESSRLDRVRFSITQKEDTEADLLLMLVLGGLYGVPVVLGILVVLLGLAEHQAMQRRSLEVARWLLVVLLSQKREMLRRWHRCLRRHIVAGQLRWGLGKLASA